MVKDLMVRELDAALGERASFLVTSIDRLEASEADGLRKQLHGVQARLLMVKRTLALREFSSRKLDYADDFVAGSVAFVIPGEDIVPAAKLLVDFAKANENKLTVRGGWVEGQVLTGKRVEELANLPPKPQLIAQLIGSLEAPITQLVFSVEAVLNEVAWVLEEAAKQKGG